MEIKVLTNDLESDYREFTLGFETSIFSVSLEYRNLLRSFLNCQDLYLLALDEGEIVGALPLFVKKSEQYGKVYNSLPFYGSNGAVNWKFETARDELIRAYNELLAGEDVVAGTLITSPFETDHSFYDSCMRNNLKDVRTGQVTPLPATPDELAGIYHHKTRNSIRKAEKSGMQVAWEDGQEYLAFLAETHCENMIRIGVPPKPRSFFDSIAMFLEYGTHYRIYTALCEGEPIAALLLFYFNNTAEYFTPVTVERFREAQPMSLIINKAMRDSVERGLKYWNWGGTSIGSKGVYDFKKRWGTVDLTYYYYTTLKQETARSLSREILLREFAYFYVLPFGNLLENE